MRLLIVATHSCPRSQRHQTFVPLPAVTRSGVRSALRVGCHCAATSGERVARSLYPASTVRPVRTGQPDPLEVRLPTCASHSCPDGQIHHVFVLLAGMIWAG